MHLTFILSSLYLSGGVRVVVEYTNRLVNRGYQISYVIPRGQIDPEIQGLISPSINVIQASEPLEKPSNHIQTARLAWSMAQVVPLSDLIISTHTPTTIVSFIASKLFNKGKAIWFYQDYLEMFDQRPVEKWLLRNAMRWHEYSITVSEACAQDLKLYSSKKAYVIGEGIDLAKYHPIPNSSQMGYANADQKVIFFLGDARPRKGMLDFLHAAEKVYVKQNNLLLWIASKEETKIDTLVPYRLCIRPTDAELARLYSACDVYVSASWYEGFGLPPLEAMACGAPVVTTDSRGIREFALDGDNCLVVPIKNPDRLADAILSLLANPTLVEQFRKNGPATAARFDWESAVDRLESALEIQPAR